MTEVKQLNGAVQERQLKEPLSLTPLKEVIASFKKILNHLNSFTHKAYKP